MENSEKRTLILRYIDAYNRFDIDGMLSMLNTDITFKNVSGGEVNAQAEGLEQFRRLAEQAKQLFSQREQTLKSIEFSDDSALANIDFAGTAAVNFSSGPKVGEIIRLSGRSKFKFHQEKICSIEDYS
ncbi:MAG: nuclear transport factor 2 family protein [Cyanobacteria bacterium J06648_16]